MQIVEWNQLGSESTRNQGIELTHLISKYGESNELTLNRYHSLNLLVSPTTRKNTLALFFFVFYIERKIIHLRIEIFIFSSLLLYIIYFLSPSDAHSFERWEVIPCHWINFMLQYDFSYYNRFYFSTCLHIFF